MPPIKVKKEVVIAPYYNLGDHFLRFDEAQSLSSGEKAQAVANLGGVSAPSSTTDNAIARFDGTSGQIQNSSATISDAGLLASTVLQSGSGSATDPGVQLGFADMGLFRQTSTRLGVSVEDVQCVSVLKDAWEFQHNVEIRLSTSKVAGDAAIESDALSTNTRYHLHFRNPNGVVGSITTGGSATAFNTSSDERLKENFRDFDAGEMIDAINIYEYSWRADGTVGYGPKAQELLNSFPHAVSEGSRGDMPGDEGFTPWGYDASKLVPLLIKEVQALRARVAALEANI